MLGKLATLITVFTLALSGPAFASPPADLREFGGETGSGAGDFDRAALVGEQSQDEIEEVELYLGPVGSQEENITFDHRRVRN